MPNSMYGLDASFPQFTGKESTEEKVNAMYDYLVQLQQNMKYLLQNLGGENFNETELKKLFDGVVTFTSDDEGRAVIDGGNIYVVRISANAADLGAAVFGAGSAGYGTEVCPEGLRWYSGMRRPGGTWDYSGGLTKKEGTAVLYAGGLQDGTRHDMRVIGKRIDLEGEVYVNGTKIG